jgi:hypothetical protein
MVAIRLATNKPLVLGSEKFIGQFERRAWFSEKWQGMMGIENRKLIKINDLLS